MRTGEIRKILVLGRSHIGDCLLTTPLLRALKRGFPRALLHVSVPEANKDLLAANPHVDEMVFRPRTQWGAKVGFAFYIRARRYDLIVSLQEKSLFYGWTTLCARLLSRPHPVTVAPDHPRTRRFYQYRSPILPNQHEVEKYLGVATLLGCPEEPNPVLELEPMPSARDRMAALIGGYGLDADTRFIGINPGGTKPEKRWTVDRFAETADRLHAELGCPVVILGSAEDHERASEIASVMRHPPIVMAGRTSLTDSAALLERCRILVTGDTGPMHMAVALAVPVVALFGPTNPAKYGPFTSLKTILRHEKPCPLCSEPCLHTIGVEECVRAAVRLYKAPPPVKPPVPAPRRPRASSDPR